MAKKSGKELIHHYNTVHQQLSNITKMGADQASYYGGLEVVGVLSVKMVNFGIESLLRELTGDDAEPQASDDAARPPVLLRK